VVFSVKLGLPFWNCQTSCREVIWEVQIPCCSLYLGHYFQRSLMTLLETLITVVFAKWGFSTPVTPFVFSSWKYNKIMLHWNSDFFVAETPSYHPTSGWVAAGKTDFSIPTETRQKPPPSNDHCHCHWLRDTAARLSWWEVSRYCVTDAGLKSSQANWKKGLCVKQVQVQSQSGGDQGDRATRHSPWTAERTLMAGLVSWMTVLCIFPMIHITIEAIKAWWPSVGLF
jgi:hypothetical protein